MGKLQGVDSPEEGRQGIQVIARSAAILRALSRNPQGLSLAAIAEEVSLPRSTVQRIVGALLHEYFVESLGPGGGFRLGPAIGRLLYQTQTDIISLVHPYLEQLTDEFQESSYLSHRIDHRVVGIDRVIAEQVLRIVFPVGADAPLYSTAAGKALLADMPVDELNRALAGEFIKQTKNTRDRSALLEELDAVRTQGVATEYEEHSLGICSLAVPIHTYLGTYAVGVALPSSRLAERELLLRRALLDCKADIEARVGPCGSNQGSEILK
jgi:Transcriptional regulator